MGNHAGYTKLKVFQKSDELVILIYKITKAFPKEELFGLVSQMRRAAISVVANIVEGYGRRNLKEKIQFYYMARGSLTELEYFIELSFKLGYLEKDQYLESKILREDVGKLLNGFIRSLQEK
jgi:four helix bundle protein